MHLISRLCFICQSRDLENVLNSALFLSFFSPHWLEKWDSSSWYIILIYITNIIINVLLSWTHITFTITIGCLGHNGFHFLMTSNKYYIQSLSSSIQCIMNNIQYNHICTEMFCMSFDIAFKSMQIMQSSFC